MPFKSARNPGGYRNYRGRRFYWTGNFKDLSDTRRRAETLRTRGSFVRIDSYREGGNTYYSIWSRFKQ